MEIGRVKETIKKRAILKKIEHCYQKETSSDIITVSDTVTAPVWLLKEERSDYIKVQIEAVFNQLSILSAKPMMMTVFIMLPEQTEESCLRFLMDCLVEIAEKKQIKISDVKAECSPDVINTVLFLTIFGRKESESLPFYNVKAFLPGKELVMVGTAALEGTIMLENAGRTILEQRFSRRFLERVRSLSSKIELENKLEVIKTRKDIGIYYIGRTGVFGALWEIASITKKGFLVERKEIPIYQETIELCEFFDVNPYMLRSGSAWILALNQGRTFVEKCKSCGIEAAIIGTMESNADKLVCNGEDCCYLTMPTAVKLRQHQPKGLQFIY